MCHTVQQAQQTTYWDSFVNTVSTTYQAASSFNEVVSQPGEAQKKFLALVKSTVGISAIYFEPVAAVVGAAVAVLKPGLAEWGVEVSDSMITAFWNKLSFKQKVVLSAGGIGVLAFGFKFSLLTYPAMVFAFKRGAQLGIENYNKQAIEHPKSK